MLLMTNIAQVLKARRHEFYSPKCLEGVFSEVSCIGRAGAARGGSSPTLLIALFDREGPAMLSRQGVAHHVLGGARHRGRVGDPGAERFGRAQDRLVLTCLGLDVADCGHTLVVPCSRKKVFGRPLVLASNELLFIFSEKVSVGLTSGEMPMCPGA